MAIHEIIMPALGMNQTSGIIVEWFKKSGEPVTVDEPVLAIETDKATMDIPSTCNGIVTQILGKTGVDIKVGTVIGIIEREGQVKEKPSLQPLVKPQNESEAELQTELPMEALSELQVGQAQRKENTLDDATAVRPENNRILVSPRARKLAAELGISLNSLVHNRQLVQPFDSRDIVKHRDTIRNDRNQVQNSLEGRVSLEKFFQFGELWNRVKEQDTSMLLVRIISDVLKKSPLFREHLSIPEHPAATVTVIRKNEWNVLSLERLSWTQDGTGPPSMEQAGDEHPVHIIFIEHSHIEAAELSTDSLLTIALRCGQSDMQGILRAGIRTGTGYHPESASGQYSCLLQFTELLISVLENPLMLLV